MYQALSVNKTSATENNKTASKPFFQPKLTISQLPNSSSLVQKQSPPAETVPRYDPIVQMIIDEALNRNGSVGNAFHDLRNRRCQSTNCGNENLAAAEHYMFARWWVEDGMAPPEVMTLIMSGAITLYQLAKLLPIVPSLCPNQCPPTPPSFFQLGWALKGVEDGLITGSIPKPPVIY